MANDSLSSNTKWTKYFTPLPDARIPVIDVESITKERITIRSNLPTTASHTIRYYIHQCGKQDKDDLGRIEVRKHQKTGVATIHLEDIEDKSFDIALYGKQKNTAISNKLSFTVTTNGDVLLLYSTDTANAIDEGSSSGYTDMYTQLKNTEENKDEKTDMITLEVYGIECDETSCGKRYHPENIFICTHIDCKDDRNIYCVRCGSFKHTNKSHQFTPNKRYIKCVKDFCEPDQKEYSSAKETAKVLVQVSAVEKFLWHHRWSLGVISKTLASSAVSATSIAVNGHMMITEATKASHYVTSAALSAGGMGVAIGPAIGTIIETVFIMYQWKLDRISTTEAFELIGISMVSNIAAGVGYFSVMVTCTAFGSAGGPIGMAVGVTAGAIAAILLGFGSRWFLNKRLKKK
eukprot:497858_1